MPNLKEKVPLKAKAPTRPARLPDPVHLTLLELSQLPAQEHFPQAPPPRNSPCLGTLAPLGTFPKAGLQAG